MYSDGSISVFNRYDIDLFYYVPVEYRRYRSSDTNLTLDANTMCNTTLCIISISKALFIYCLSLLRD